MTKLSQSVSKTLRSNGIHFSMVLSGVIFSHGIANAA